MTALGNKLGELSGQREAIAAALAGSPDWSIWLQKTLQPRNERENVHRWACGRPSQQDMVQRGNSGEESMLEVGRVPAHTFAPSRCFIRRHYGLSLAQWQCPQP